MRRNAEVEAKRKAREDEIRNEVEAELLPRIDELSTRVKELQAQLEQERQGHRKMVDDIERSSVEREGELKEEFAKRLEDERNIITSELQARSQVDRAMHEAEIANRVRADRTAIEEGARRNVEAQLAKIAEDSRSRFEQERERLKTLAETELAEKRRLIDDARAREEAAYVERRRAAEAQIGVFQAELRKKADEELSDARRALEEEFRKRIDSERRMLEDARVREIAEAREAQRQLEVDVRMRFEDEFGVRLGREREQMAAEFERLFANERRKIEEDAYAKAEDEIRRKYVEEGRAAEEIRLKAEEERARREQEELERRQEEENRRQQDDDETRKYEEAVRLAIEEGRRIAQGKKIRDYLDRGVEAIVQARYDDALVEISRALRLEPKNQEALKLEQRAYRERDAFVKQQYQAARRVEQQHKVEDLQKLIVEQSRREAEEQRARAVRDAKISAHIQRVKEFERAGNPDTALAELEKVYALDPGNAIGREIEKRIISARDSRAHAEAVSVLRSAESETRRLKDEDEELKRNVDREQLRQEAQSTFRSMIKQAWANGLPPANELAMIEVVRLSLGLSADEKFKLETEIKFESYEEAVQRTVSGAIPGIPLEHLLEPLRHQFGFSFIDAEPIEQRVQARLGR